MRRTLTGFKILLILTMIFQSCSKEEDTYTNLTDEAKELLLYEIGDTFQLKNTTTDEIITLTVNGKRIDFYKDGATPGNVYGGFGGDSYYEYGEYFFSDDTNCYDGSVSVEARGNGNFEFFIFTGDCFGEYLTTFEFNSLGFDYSGEIISLNINGTEYNETYILNSSNNTIFYTKENGIIQIVDDVNEIVSFTIVE